MFRMVLGPGTRLSVIFEELASYQNPDFFGMDTKYNDFKACVSLILTFTVVQHPHV